MHDLRTAYLLPTGRCNLGCTACYATLENYGRRSKQLELSPDQYGDVVRQLVKLGVRTFDISGGEPLIYPHIGELCRKIKSHPDTRIVIVSNGTEPRTAALLGELQGLVDRIVFSIDSSVPEQHERLRGSRGAFARTLASVQLARGLAFKQVGLNQLALGETIGTFPDLLALASELELDTFSLLMCRDVSENGSQLSAMPDLDALRVSWAAGVKHASHHEHPARIEFVVPAFFYAETSGFRRTIPQALRERISFASPNLRGIGAFVDRIVIKPGGTITGDTAMANESIFDIGAVDGRLAELWDSEGTRWHSLLKLRQERLRESSPCKTCPRWNTCRGGCAAAALQQSGDYTQYDRTCEPYRLAGAF